MLKNNSIFITLFVINSCVTKTGKAYIVTQQTFEVCSKISRTERLRPVLKILFWGLERVDKVKGWHI